jgi:hypothetical protein
MIYQVEKILDRTIDEIYPNLCYQMIPISCEDAFISRIYKRYPAIKLDDKFLNKIGINNFGKRAWNKLNSSKKSAKLKELVKDDSLLDLTGFNSLKQSLKNDLSSKGQLGYILDNLYKHYNNFILDKTKVHDASYYCNKFVTYLSDLNKYREVCCEIDNVKFNKKKNRYSLNLYDNFKILFSNYLHTLTVKHESVISGNIHSINVDDIVQTFNIYTNSSISVLLYGGDFFKSYHKFVEFCNKCYPAAVKNSKSPDEFINKVETFNKVHKDFNKFYSGVVHFNKYTEIKINPINPTCLDSELDYFIKNNTKFHALTSKDLYQTLINLLIITDTKKYKASLKMYLEYIVRSRLADSTQAKFPHDETKPFTHAKYKNYVYDVYELLKCTPLDKDMKFYLEQVYHTTMKNYYVTIAKYSELPLFIEKEYLKIIQ